MSLPEITYYVTYYSDYPGLNGDEHAFFLNASTSQEGLGYVNDYIASHPAENCLIDHGSRLADYEITDEMKLKIRRAIWSALSIFNKEQPETI